MLSERATIRSSRSGEGKTKPVQQVKTTKSTLRPSRRGNTLKWMIFIVAILWLAFMFGMLIGILKNDISLKREATPSKGITLPKAPTLKRGKGTPRNIPRDSLRRPSITNDNEVTVPEGGIVDKPNLLPLSENPDAYRSPLLIFTCRRQQYLSQTLDDILENIGDHCAFGCPVVVSEDGGHKPIREVIESYREKFAAKHIPLIHLQHPQANADKQFMRLKNPNLAYEALAQHYGWALQKVFDGLDPSFPQTERVIILEEDIHTSPDFLGFMKATSKLLDTDPNLFAVSAYNDNGHMVGDPGDVQRIVRSDFFPGLGWMMNRRLWKEELEAKWPKGYWDDWLREPVQRKDRHILRPEVSRTFHFGNQGGTSANQFGSILGRIKLNKENVDWSNLDLSYLSQDRFDQEYSKLVGQSTLAHSVEEALKSVESQNTKIEYNGIDQFKDLAHRLGIMEDEKAMVPRTSYHGVVEMRPLGNRLLFLTPPT